ncbi:MAG: GNAT family N-acetyltransferase [Thermoguttaceae bacterium]
MSHPRLIHLDCVDKLRDAAPLWDDLWRRSDVTSPLSRAEMVAQWLEQFSSHGDFHGLVIEHRGQWVAAIPLVSRLRQRLFNTGGLTANEWSVSGDLLLDAHSTSDAALDKLVSAMRDISWQMLWFNEVPLDTTRWMALRQATDRATPSSDYHANMQVGLIEIGNDWEAYRRGLSKKHRNKMSRCGRRLAERGDVRMELFSRPQPQRIEPLLRKAFEVEDLGWKGQIGTSVLRTAGMFEFFVRQAEQLAGWGQLELALLYCGERPVAFSYGYAAKGVSHWHKIGYDPQYDNCTPGQLLQYQLIEKYHGDADCQAVNTMGPLTDALAKWDPTAYTLGRLMIAPRRKLARFMVYACKRWVPYLRRLRGGVATGGTKRGRG